MGMDHFSIHFQSPKYYGDRNILEQRTLDVSRRMRTVRSCYQRRTSATENVLRGVDVTVVNVAAYLASPFSYSKSCDTCRPRLRQIATSRAGLGCVLFIHFLEQHACAIAF